MFSENWTGGPSENLLGLEVSGRQRGGEAWAVWKHWRASGHD
jgi:hypothetical protein